MRKTLSQNCSIMIKVLFITHNCSPTGAVLQLKEIIESLITDHQIVPIILAKEQGLLFNEFKLLGPTFCFIPKNLEIDNQSTFKNIIKKILLKLFWIYLRIRIVIWAPDVLYTNTLLNDNIFKTLKLRRKKAIIHAHELEITIDYYKKTRNSVLNLTEYPHIICVSSAVQKYITDYHGYSKHKTSLVHNIINEKFFKEMPKGYLRKDLQITSELKVIGTCGSISNQKGFFEFLDIALAILSKSDTNYRFVWIGTNTLPRPPEEYIPEAAHKYFHFCGYTPTPEKYYPDFDLFITTSHEESVGMAAIECALQGIPYVCSNNLEFLYAVAEKYDYTIELNNPKDSAKKIISILNKKDNNYNIGIEMKGIFRELFVKANSINSIFKQIEHIKNND